MSIQDYFGQSTGDFPPAKTPGVPGPWLDLCTLHLPHGRLWAGDPWLANDQDGVVIKVKPGTYRVQVMGMDFEGHRRIARVRLFEESASSCQTIKTAHSVSVDMGMLGICDIHAMNHAVEPDHYEDFIEDLNKVTDEDIAGCIAFEYASNRFEMVLLPAGIGDGQYDVLELKSHDKMIGMEIEFLPEDFMMD